VDFLVKVGRDGTRGETVWSRRVEPSASVKDIQWVTGDIALDPWAGGDHVLTLETRSPEATEPAARAVWAAPFVSSARAANPLVVVYLVDALRADHTGPYGYSRKTTPALDAFARDAVVFEQAVTQAPWTKPAVASLMTSLPPTRHRVIRRFDGLSDRFVTLAELLAESGWATGAVVTNALVYAHQGGFDQGFDGFAGLHNRKGQRTRQVRAARVVDAALSWIDARRGRPTFLYVHTMDPHWPYRPPPPFDGMFAEAQGWPPHEVETPEQERRRSIDQYDGEIAYGDQEFGRFLQQLRARELYDRALIVFLADHGEELFDHGGWGHGSTLYDELIRIPLLVKFPGGRYRGRRVGAQVQMIDLAPTILEATGGPVAPSFVGRPLQRVLDGDTRAIPAFVSTQHWGVTLAGLRTEKDKYIRRFSPAAEEALFDLLQDPAERADRAGANSERVRALRAQTEAALPATSYRYTLRAFGNGSFSLAMRTTGRFEDVAASGLSAGETPRLDQDRQTLAVELPPRAGKPREVSFRIRPMGATVRLEGTRSGRPLRPKDVTYAVGRHPEGFPFVLPDPERENPLAEAERLFIPPSEESAGVRVWLVEPLDKTTHKIDEDTLDALRALGYVEP